jgi:sugar lactone lactonase YvrE
MGLSRFRRVGMGMAVATVLQACGGGSSSSDGAQPSRTSTTQGSVGGTVSGYAASSDPMVIRERNSGVTVTLAGGDTHFELPGTFDFGFDYALDISQPPAAQHCRMERRSGKVGTDSPNYAILACHDHVTTAELSASGLAGVSMGISGMAQDEAGNIYLSGEGSNTIRRVTRTGKVETWAGACTLLPPYYGQCNFEYATGSRLMARFTSPRGLAWRDGQLYVADADNHLIRRIDAGGVVHDVAGVPQNAGTDNGPAGSARFVRPDALLFDAAGNLFVSDAGAHQIRMISTAGQVSLVAGDPLGGSGNNSGDVAAVQARFHAPMGLAWAKDGSLLVADSENNAIRVLKKDKAGAWRVSTLAPSFAGYADGGKSFVKPWRIGVDARGYLHVASQDSDSYMVDPTNVASASTYGAAGMLDFSRAGRVLRVSETASPVNVTMVDLDPSGRLVATYLASSVYGHADGFGVAPKLAHPIGLAHNTQGDVLVADVGSEYPLYRVNADGGRVALSTYPYALQAPDAVVADDQGAFYVADTQSDRVLKVAADGAVSQFAVVSAPSSMAFDAVSRTLWVVSATQGVIQRLALSGQVLTPVPLPAGFAVNERTVMSPDGAGGAFLAEPRLVKGYPAVRLVKVDAEGREVFSYPGADYAYVLADGGHHFLPYSQDIVGLVHDGAGALYVALKDSVVLSSHTPTSFGLILKLNAAGAVRVVSGSPPTFGGTAPQWLNFMAHPLSMSVDKDGALHVPSSVESSHDYIGGAGPGLYVVD